MTKQMAAVAFFAVFTSSAFACENVEHTSNESKAPSAVGQSDSLCASTPHSKPEFSKSNGKFEGCRLTKIAPGSVHARLGLKVGDVVQTENSSSNEMTMKLESSVHTENKR